MPLTGWGRRCRLLIDHTKVDADTADFPWLFTLSNLPSEMFDADGTYPALNGGGDVRFSADPNGNNRLSIEVVTFVTNNNPALGKAEIWVKVPFISTRTDTEVYVFYNKAAQTQPARSAAYGSEDVWSDGFAAVWHMNQDMTGSAPQLTDSTANLNHGSARNSTWQSWASGDTVDALFGRGLYFYFGGYDNCQDITIPHATSMCPTSGHAIEAIAAQDGGTDGHWSMILQKGNDIAPVYSYGLQQRDQTTGPGKHNSMVQKSGTLYGSTVETAPRGDWYHWMGTYEHAGPNYNQNLHLNGAAGTPVATASGAVEYDTYQASIGNRASHALWTNYEGIMEEVRLHGKYRAPAYAKLGYTTTFDSSATTVGTPASPSTVISVPMKHDFYRFRRA